MTTLAEIKLAELIQSGEIGPTGHAPGADRDSILSTSRLVDWLVLVESDPDGYPLMDEKWEAIRYVDGSLLIVTYVRGREEVDFWKAIPNLDHFEILRRYARAQQPGKLSPDFRDAVKDSRMIPGHEDLDKLLEGE